MGKKIQGTGAGIEEANDRFDVVERDLRTLETDPITEADVIEALGRLDGLWSELFPVERARIVGLLVSRVDVRPDSIELRLRGDGLRSLVAEVGARNGTREADATA